MKNLFHSPAIHLLALLATLLVTNLDAASFYGNSSHDKWKTAETEHFRFHYRDSLEAYAEKVAEVAETVHDSLVLRYGAHFPGKVETVVRNALFSNGLANSSLNTMQIWITSWDFRLRGTRPWLRDVVTHEFGHITSLNVGSKWRPSIQGLQLGYVDYYNEKVRSDALMLLPFNYQPIWFAEGVAQYESTRMGYDAWDSHRAMVLRVAASADKLLPMEKMTMFSGNALDFEAGPYTQGFSLVRYIAKNWGDSAVTGIFRANGKVANLTLSGAMEDVLGFGEDELFRHWKKDLVQKSMEKKDSLGELQEGNTLGRGGFYQDFPRYRGGALYGISNFGSDSWTAGLFRLPLDTAGLEKKKKPDSLGVWPLPANVDKSFHLEKPYLEKGYDIFVSDSGASPLVVYTTYRHRDQNGRLYFDIVADDTLATPLFGKDPGLRFVTKYLDAVYPVFSPDGQKIAFVRRIRGTSRFALSIAELPAVGEGPADYEDLFLPPDSAEEGFGVFTPSFSPDGQKIAFSYYDGKSRKLGMVGLVSRKFTKLADDGFDNREPTWWPDGKSIVYSSDHGGIFNLIRLHFADGRREKISNTLGGIFSPALASDSLELAFIRYDTAGFTLARLLRDSLKTDLLDSLRGKEHGGVLPDYEVKFDHKSRNYGALPRSTFWIPLLVAEETGGSTRNSDEGEVELKAGTHLGISDPVGKNYLSFGFLLGLENGYDYVNTDGINPKQSSDFSAYWENRSLPPTLSLGYFRRNLTAHDTVRSEDPSIAPQVDRFSITLSGLQAGAGYSLFKKGDSLDLLAGMGSSVFDLYESGFRWAYQKNLYAGVQAAWRTRPDHLFAGTLMPSGSGFVGQLRYSNNDLFRPGSFWESFTVSESGAILPIYRNFRLTEGFLHSFSNWGVFFHPDAKLSLSADASSILVWESDQRGIADTLDSYLSHGLFLPGYPFLDKKGENLLFRGENTAMLQAHYLFPLWSDIATNWWIFSTRDLYLDIFAAAGLSWDGSFLERSTPLIDPASWSRAVGLELRLSQQIFYHYPFEAFLQLSRGLDHLPTGERPEALPGWSAFPSAMRPTRLHVGVGYSFSNSGSGLRSVVHPLRRERVLR